MHLPGAHVLRPVHPATQMCTPCAGCTLNFEHCIGTIHFDNDICETFHICEPLRKYINVVPQRTP